MVSEFGGSEISDLMKNRKRSNEELFRITSSIIISCNLTNSSHYDVNDGSKGFAVFTCLKGESVSNWYFIIPNVLGKTMDGNTFQGIAIRLYHGVAISWDGRVIRHCTSMMKGVNDATVVDGIHVHGSFVGHKTEFIIDNVLHRAQQKANDVATKKDDMTD